ncbi:hypothetical protein BJI67_16205 (plasmid) [Acidihalobacter aeolianus]|uniref:Uncharacterized protein n=1 Tax=Acidihalobacter aeolianus TaxID=2792603 RepID=A0A1D8KCU2_9GAMM|nr:hypothetical protein BJI67_16205 [Acidihalobacter aeolianus]
MFWHRRKIIFATCLPNSIPNSGKLVSIKALTAWARECRDLYQYKARCTPCSWGQNQQTTEKQAQAVEFHWLVP